MKNKWLYGLDTVGWYFFGKNQWRSQNAKKVTHINGRILDQAMIL